MTTKAVGQACRPLFQKGKVTTYDKRIIGSSSNLVGNRYSYHRFQDGIVVVKQRYVKGAVLHFVETLDVPLLHNYWVPKESMNRVAAPLP